MARGWESKSVEEQIAAAGVRTRKPPARLSAAESERQRKLGCLQLSRTRIQRDLQTASNPRYRTQLEEALAHLEAEIAGLSAPPKRVTIK
jgi:hypothetical protein